MEKVNYRDSCGEVNFLFGDSCEESQLQRFLWRLTQKVRRFLWRKLTSNILVETESKCLEILVKTRDSCVDERFL